MMATILLIEASPDLCKLFEHLLQAEGHQVLASYDWQGADALLAAHHPDMIIFDWALSNTAGYAWAERLRASAATASIPILFVCGDPPPRATAELLGSIGVSTIEKPFDIFVFRKRVSALLGMRERAIGGKA
ncbi:MAG TPA: response regulator [Kouleothrix sp.]|uniref:response regulator n=1 Tax=Kouleothrix sp. TaxID=2779161 RepID=UPI002B7F71CD|nr:response regulator [Kouleothrix sp.]HRC75738.1 response regulator [Kouleothrix sp.]